MAHDACPRCSWRPWEKLVWGVTIFVALYIGAVCISKPIKPVHCPRGQHAVALHGVTTCVKNPRR